MPSDRLASFLTDRVEGIAQARKYVRAMGAEDLPILVIAIEHDGEGVALLKQPKSPTGMAKRQRHGSESH